MISRDALLLSCRKDSNQVHHTVSICQERMQHDTNTTIYTLGIQSYSQLMIGVSNHLLSIIFRFHYHSQKVIRSLGTVKTWTYRVISYHTLHPPTPSCGRHMFEVSFGRHQRNQRNWKSKVGEAGGGWLDEVLEEFLSYKNYVVATQIFFIFTISGWWFQIFSPLLGEDDPNLTSIFQMGWNHQLEKDGPLLYYYPPQN